MEAKLHSPQGCFCLFRQGFILQIGVSYSPSKFLRSAGYYIVGNTFIAHALTAVLTSAELIKSELKLCKDEKECCRDDD